MPGLDIRFADTVDRSGAITETRTTVEITPGTAPPLSSFHNGLTRVTIEIGVGARVTFTGTPGVLRRLFQRLDDEVCSAEVEAEHARALRPYDAAADDWADTEEGSP